MPTPEDRAFFESLNKDLAKNIGDSLKEALKESDKGKGKGDGKDDGTAAVKISAILSTLNKTVGSLMSLVGENVSNVAAFGDTIARSAVATKQTGLFQAEKLTDEFGKFGFNLRQVGVMLNSAMLHNVHGVTKSTQRFIARTQGFDTNMGSVAKFLQTQTNVLGNDIESTETLGHVMQDVARESGIVATAMFDAVNAFTENTRTLKAVYGGEVGKQFQTALGSLAGSIGKGFEDDVKGLISALSPTDFEGTRKITILGRSIGAGDLSPQAMRADPAGHLVKAITALARIADEADAVKPGDEFSRGKFIEQRMVALGISINQMGIAQRLMQNAQARGQSLATFMTPKGMTAAERAADTVKAQEEVVTHSEAAAKAMYDFAVETAATTAHYKKLQTATEITKDMFYGLGDEAHNATRQLFGFSTALAGMASQALGILTPLSNLLLTFALFRRPGALLRGGKGGGGVMGRIAPGLRPVPTASKVKFPGSVFQRKGQPRGGRYVFPSKTSRAMAQGRQALGIGGGFKGALKAGRLPVGLGGLMSGGLEFADSGDVSRSLAVGAGGGLGGWGGMAAGAAAGSFLGPIGTVVGGLIGGLIGAWTGEKAARTIHDAAGLYENDPSNVAEQASVVRADQAQTDRIVASADRTTDAVNTLAAALNEGVVPELAGTQEQRVAAMEQQYSLEATVAASQAHGPGDLLTQVLGGGRYAPSLGAFAGIANSGGNSGGP